MVPKPAIKCCQLNPCAETNPREDKVPVCLGIRRDSRRRAARKVPTSSNLRCFWKLVPVVTVGKGPCSSSPAIKSCPR